MNEWVKSTTESSKQERKSCIYTTNIIENNVFQSTALLNLNLSPPTAMNISCLCMNQPSPSGMHVQHDDVLSP